MRIAVFFLWSDLDRSCRRHPFISRPADTGLGLPEGDFHVWGCGLDDYPVLSPDPLHSQDVDFRIAGQKWHSHGQGLSREKAVEGIAMFERKGERGQDGFPAYRYFDQAGSRKRFFPELRGGRRQFELSGLYLNGDLPERDEAGVELVSPLVDYRSG